jgi:hypothetical protein
MSTKNPVGDNEKATTVVADDWEETLKRSRALLFDHLIGPQQERFRYRQAERLGGRQIDNEIELGRLLDRNVGWLRTAQNFVDKVRSTSEQIGDIWSIGHKTTRYRVFPQAMHRWQSPSKGQAVDASPVGAHERVSTDIKCISAAIERLEGGCDVLGSPDFECDDIECRSLGTREICQRIKCSAIDKVLPSGVGRHCGRLRISPAQGSLFKCHRQSAPRDERTPHLRLRMIADLERCIGCQTCMAACRHAKRAGDTRRALGRF